MQMLNVIKETMLGKISLINMTNRVDLVDLPLNEFWENFTKIQSVVSKFAGDNLKIVDVYTDLKNLYFDYFKRMEEEMNKLPVDKFKGFDPEDMLYDSLVKISENTALNEFLSEKHERLEQYAIVDLICEIILFKKTDNWYELEVVPNDKVDKTLFDTGVKIHDLAQNHTDYLNEKVSFDFKKLNDVLQREGNLRIIKNLREQFALRVIQKQISDEAESEFINKIKILHQQIQARMNDLSE